MSIDGVNTPLWVMWLSSWIQSGRRRYARVLSCRGDRVGLGLKCTTSSASLISVRCWLVYASLTQSLRCFLGVCALNSGRKVVLQHTSLLPCVLAYSWHEPAKC